MGTKYCVRGRNGDDFLSTCSSLVETQGGSVKCLFGGIVTSRISSVNVGTMKGRDGEVVGG